MPVFTAVTDMVEATLCWWQGVRRVGLIGEHAEYVRSVRAEGGKLLREGIEWGSESLARTICRLRSV